MKLSGKQIEDLRNVLSEGMGHSGHIIRTTIKELLPDLFKSQYDVGKYYTIESEDGVAYIKCRKVDSDSMWGYGLLDDGELTWYEDNNRPWGIESDIYDIKEITKEEFLEQIKKYAIEVLGFKKGIKFKNMVSGFIQTIELESHTISHNQSDIENVYCGRTPKSEWGCKGSDSNAVIFKDGKFAEIIGQPKETENNNFTYKKSEATTWQPTVVFRWCETEMYDHIYERNKIVLQQKWQELDTGAEEWREIETV